jgi:hypothetical protein
MLLKCFDGKGSSMAKADEAIPKTIDELPYPAAEQSGSADRVAILLGVKWLR